MNKLFVFQPGSQGAYRRELEAAYQKVKGERLLLESGHGFSVDYLINGAIDVVISNGLPKELYLILKGLNIVMITIDSLKDFYSYADIVIDYLSGDRISYFAGKDYSVIDNENFDISAILDLIKILEWDSAFFGYNVAYLSCMHLTDNIYYRIEQFIRKEHVRLAEYLCNCHDSRSVKVAEKDGFNFVDIRLTFYRNLIKLENCTLPDGISFRQVDKKAIPTLRGISKDIYKDSRYFFDANFSREKAMEFYQGWVEKGVLGTYDDECWGLFENGTPFAFCTVKYNKGNSANIGLFGVDQNYHGRGFGKLLLMSVFNMLQRKGRDQVFVVTQGRNYPAQNLYQSAGFKTKTTQLWYHKWI
jgi:GNAT superfamily N-acetyltransferase